MLQWLSLWLQEEMIEEVAKMVKITNHPNMVRMYGVVVDRTPPLLVTEYYQYGSLFALLSKARKQVETHNAKVSKGRGREMIGARGCESN
jgi:serine/threonine protein kinase